MLKRRDEIRQDAARYHTHEYGEPHSDMSSVVQSWFWEYFHPHTGTVYESRLAISSELREARA